MKIWKIIKENKGLLLGITGVVVLCFSLFLFKVRPFALAQDQVTQYELFYEEWIRMVKTFFSTKELPFYSWNNFLGTDFFTTKSYYLTGDFFLPFYLITPFSIRITLMITTIILIYISGLSMSIFLKKWGIQNASTRQMVGFCYALSGLAMMYFSNFMFLRFYALLPLLFYGVEKYIQQKKVSFFALMVMILFLQSYYFMFSTSIFLILYFFISVLYKENQKPLKILQRSLPLIGAYVIGFLMSAVLLVPTILMMLNHPRVGERTVGLIWDFKIILGFIYSHITAPFNLYSDIPYIFVSGYNGHEYWYSIYAGGLIWIAALQQFFFGQEKRKRKILGVGYIVLLLFTMLQPLNSVMHGFSEPSFRWMFLVTIYICLVAAISLDQQLYDTKKLTISYGIYSLLFMCGTILGIFTNIITFPEHTIHLAVSSLCLLWGWILIVLIQKEKIKWTYYLTGVEIALFTFAFCWILSNPAYNYTQTISAEYVQYYQKIDEDIVYRMYIPREYLLPNTVLNLNQSLALDYKSVSMYDTTYEPNLSEFLVTAGFDTHIVDITDPELMKMLGVKYIVAYGEEELPNPEEFEYVYNLDHLKVYKWKDYNSLGFTYSNTESSSENIDWLEELIVPEVWQDINLPKTERQQLHVYAQGQNSLKGTIIVEDQSILFLSIPYNKGWKVIDNGQEVDFEKVQLGFIGVLLEEGEHNIELYYMPEGFKLGFGLSVVGVLGWIGLVFIDRRNKK